MGEHVQTSSAGRTRVQREEARVSAVGRHFMLSSTLEALSTNVLAG